jgi:hypothetical protein
MTFLVDTGTITVDTRMVIKIDGVDYGIATGVIALDLYHNFSTVVYGLSAGEVITVALDSSAPSDVQVGERTISFRKVN